MRNIAFSMTTAQVRARTKDVTRRVGWDFLRPGDVLQGIEKGQGLKKGETVVRLARIRIVSVRKEPLQRLIDEPAYGADECRREGFPEMTPREFGEHFIEGHRFATWTWPVTRIEFEYLEDAEVRS